ncbi:glycoside hydrolase family 97 catalytic domain-containing protein [Akkermansia muciniphila]|nr:glycoside hydrolase family 97 protein [Akkermansia muciniphila]MBS5974072.1 glycoside hydrolase family 97 catalytic domain-containing protein [Akkermansia muciniphila]QWP50509.1 glycoside hydrolase family 97 catalytic domain-containing protein [Akkermansia muciniphila]QWP55375.1 glycoside hydrolase family 97 catalytic domain-containing protein [Akkermansia muciniphila]QWP57692.1 glycoside hydrolase family 97 catalytic domain-containing protein [Akkermansia muciniphila]
MLVKSLIMLSSTAGCLLTGAGQAAETHASLQSPDGRLSWRLHAGSQTAHSLKKGGKTILEPSGLGIVVNGKNLAGGITGWNVEKVKDNVCDTFETRGKYPSSSVCFNEYVVSGNNSSLRLRARVFNNGVAFRYEWTEEVKKAPSLNISEEKTSFAFPEKTVLWTQDASSALGPCEGVWSPSRITDFKKDPGNPRSCIRTMPITAELPGGGVALIQEAANFNRQWSGIKFSLQDGACHTVYFQDPGGFSAPSSSEMPWRVILVNDDLNGLVRNDVIPSLAPEPDRKLFPEGSKASWIRPGRSTWTWWDRGNVLENDQYAFVDMAAEFGWEYHLVDEGWKKWGPSLPESMGKLAKLASYAAGKNVGIWVWVRWSDVNNPANDWENMRSFFGSLSKTGIRGIKIDFMDSASQERLAFYDAVAENLAKNKLMVNFHGANTPTGEERSWPHEMSREGIYGGEQNIWAAIGGQHYCALPFTRLISGHADFTGGYFGHEPKLRGSSWTLQMAANIIYTSPMLHWVSNPADMEAAFPKDSPEREVVRNIPSVWEETIVLPPSAIGECAAFARRSGNQWYIALMNGDGRERTVSIPLNFLDKNTAYQASILRDLAEKNDGWSVETRKVTSGNTLSFTMRIKGGGIVRMVPSGTRHPAP